MAPIKKQKNTVEESLLDADGDINIGDKTVNIFGMDSDVSGIKWAIKAFISAFIIFFVGSIVFAIWHPK
jgi:hypothetical protein